MSRTLDETLKQICRDLSMHCDEVVVIAKPQGRGPKVATLGSSPECLQLTKFASDVLTRTIAQQ
jgi:hypothetical protein